MVQSDRLNQVMSGHSLHCIYASTSGNVETVVETAADVWRQAGWTVELHRAEKTSIEVIENNQRFLLATSTWEHGALNPFFATLFKNMSKIDLKGKQAAFIGLGDQRYEPVLFCEGMEIVKRLWETNHGEIVGYPLKINGEPYSQLQKTVVPWAKQIVEKWPAATTTSGLQRLLGGVFNHA